MNSVTSFKVHISIRILCMYVAEIVKLFKKYSRKHMYVLTEMTLNTWRNTGLYSMCILCVIWNCCPNSKKNILHDS